MAKRRMTASVSQREAVELFDLPTKILYVCDGEKECGKPCCLDHSRTDVCHHTEDFAHALYETHYMGEFEAHPAVRGDEAAVIYVEPIRG